jgi:HSP20 family protein
MDAAGVPSTAVRVLFRAGIILVVGEKAPVPITHEQTFHLVEREFGRFARAVKIAGAFDVAQARATVHQGELTIVLPKTAERRGRAHRIPVVAGSGEPS